MQPASAAQRSDRDATGAPDDAAAVTDAAAAVKPHANGAPDHLAAPSSPMAARGLGRPGADRSHQQGRSRGRSRSRSLSHSREGRSRSRGRSSDSSRERRRRRKQQRHRSGSKSKSKSASPSGSGEDGGAWGRSHTSSRSRSRSHSVESGDKRQKHRRHKHHHKHRDKAKHHSRRHHQHKKRSRSRSGPQEGQEGGAQHSQPCLEGPFAAAANVGAGPPPVERAPTLGAAAAADGDGELLQRDSSVGASSLVKLSLKAAPQPSPATAAAATVLLPHGSQAAAAARQQQRPGGPSPLGPPGLTRVHTPSAAALAAQGLDVSEVALVQPSPLAAEATVAALSALMQQPARQPSLPHPQPSAKRGGGGGGGGTARGSTAGDKKKQLLSFGDELEEDEGPGVGRRPGSVMSEATAKRFKHEKTLVMLNPQVGGDPKGHPLSSYEEEESLPCSPAAPLDKRLGHVLWGSAQAKGMRPYMEDRHTVINSFQPRTSGGQVLQDGVFRAYAAVFDGHNGASAAEHAADRVHHVLAAEPAIRTCTGDGPPSTVAQEEERVAAALIHSFESVDREIMTRCRVEGTKGGATGLVVLRIGHQLYAAHCGDTRAVMSRGGAALRLTEDHKPNLPRERKRVEGIGGRVDFARCWRVIVEPGDGRPASGLAVSRSFGDPDFKEPLHLVTATPDVIRERLLPGDDFVILASDGLWDVLSDSEACSVVRRHLQQAGAPRQITPPQLLPGAAAFGAGSVADQLRRPPVLTAALATAAAERLVQESLDRGTMDNVTAVVGLLQWD